jgi:HK97 gp10 family phage protein
MAKGLQGLNNFIVEQIPAFVDEVLFSTAEKVAADMLEIARRIVPVDTGFLRSKLSTEITKIQGGYRVTLFVDLEVAMYGHFVEFGTIKMQAQPYIGPATVMAHQRSFT